MQGVVRPEIEGGQNFRQHAAVMGAVGCAKCDVDPTVLQPAARSPIFLHECLERLLAHDREDHLADHAVRVADRRLRDPEQDARLAPNLAVLLDEFLNHPALGARSDPVRDLDEELD